MTQDTALKILKLGHTTFLTGAPGAGKSHTIREYIKYLKSHNIKHAVTASTGIASTHINGTTIHSWSGIGIKDNINSYDLDKMEENQKLWKRWNDTSVLIIDEVSMLSSHFINMLDKVAKHLRRNDKPFGGIQIVFVGDFFQLPPVVRGYSEQDLENIFAFNSESWKKANPVVCYLSENHRQEDEELINILNALRDGSVDEYHIDILNNLSSKKSKKEILKLYTHNESVDYINKEAFDLIKEDSRTYTMITSGKKPLIETLKKNCIADEVLELKVGAKVIFIKNSQDRSYVNGSMGKVIDFKENDTPVVKLNNGKTVDVYRDSWKIEEEGKVLAEVSQIPLKLAWAITVHKSQGMTLDEAEIDLKSAFTMGQGYVAISRVKTLSGLYLNGFNNTALQVSEVVKDTDSILREKSLRAENAIYKYSDKQLKEKFEKFILSSGGSVEEIDFEDEEDEFVQKVPSHLKTKELIEKEMTLSEISKERNLSVDTIIGHIEKLVEQGEIINLKNIIPKGEKEIKKSFKKLKTDKLTPVYEDLKGKYSYQDIRVVRCVIKK